MAATEALRDRLQNTLGSAYTIERELGGGGMSRVFVARDVALRRDVVVKVLPPELLAGVNLERFRREILVAAGLQNPHIVPVLTSGETDGVPWFTMPFVQGESLRDRLARGPLPISETLNILRDVAKALTYAHERGVVHRDIKPDNVLLTGGTAVVTDFGIAKALSVSRTNGGDEPTATRGALTQVGMSIGTPLYMAPEQAAADPDADHRADLYAFGCLAYELLAGRPPFAGRSPQQLLAAHMSESPQPVAELRRDTPPLVADLVMSCLEKDPAKRPATAADVVRMLDVATTTASSASTSSVLLGRRVSIPVAIALWALVFGATWILAKAAIVGIGLPDWVLPGALIVAGLGLPVVLFTALVQRAAHRALTRTPTLTPGGTVAPHGTMATLALKASPHISWQRTSRGGVIAFGTFALLVVAFMAARALGIGPAGSLLAAGKITPSERLIVADFRADAADSSLSAAVTEGMRTSLSQSHIVSVVPASFIADALQRMRRPITERLDLDVARQIAQREGIRGIVDGSIAPISGGYLLTTRLVAAGTGDQLAAYQETVDAKGIIDGVDDLARKLRGRIGESLKSVRADPPLAQVTTASLDALQKYGDALRVAHSGNMARSVALLREATAVDSNFASAYRVLAALMGDARLGTADERRKVFLAAYAHRDRLPEPERLELEAYRHNAVGGDPDRQQAIAAYESLVSRYPVGFDVLDLYGNILTENREYARAAAVYRRDIAQEPDVSVSWYNLVLALLNEGRRAEARSTVNEMGRHFPGAYYTNLALGHVLYAEGKLDSESTVIQRSDTDANPQFRAQAHYFVAVLVLLRGRRSPELAQARAIDAAAGRLAGPLTDSLLSAHIDAEVFARPEAAIRRADAALARYPLASVPVNERPYLQAARVYALAGHADRARALVAEYDAAVTDPGTLYTNLPLRHSVLGLIALAEQKPQAALAEFRASDSLPDGPAACPICADPGIGVAFDRMGMADSAIAAFEHYETTPYGNREAQDMWYLAAIEKRLGELYEAKGDAGRAAQHYERFVELWNDPDAELRPQLEDVKRRLARLAQTEQR